MNVHSGFLAADIAPMVSSTVIEKQKLLSAVEKFKGKKVLILGDVGVDEYIQGDVRRISPEAPVPVLEVDKEYSVLGLASNVANNIKTLGGEPILVSVVGQDRGAESFKELLNRCGISADYLIYDSSRPTTRKARIMAKNHQYVRVDYESRKFLSESIENVLLKKLAEVVPSVDAVILEDYSKGVISKTLVPRFVEICKKHNKKIFVDPHSSNLADYYKGIDLLKPNFNEAVALSGLNFDDLRDSPSRILEIGKVLQAKTGATEIVMTRGKDGMMIFMGDKVMQVPTFAKEVYDVAGAGDTVISALTLGYLAELDLVHSAMLANYAAGVVVGQFGCVPCKRDDLVSAIGGTVGAQ